VPRAGLGSLVRCSTQPTRTVFTLLRLPTPSVDLCSDVELYVRLESNARYSFVERAVVMDAGDAVTTDTYFGVIPVGKWHRHTSIRNVEVVIETDGEVEVEVIHQRPQHSARVVAIGHGTGDVTVALPSIDELADGHAFVRVIARGDAVRFRGLTTRTSDEPARDVRVGISITTFNRQGYVQANVARTDAYLAERPELADHVRLVVVDNGRNLELEPPRAITTRVVPNRNLGGAGGFARGMMELRDEGWATHALFMDDDIAFEPEIFGRVVGLLSYATDPQLCIAGAMLREEHPTLQFEAGAVVRTHSTVVWHAQAHDRDLSDVDDLLLNEGDDPIDYGGWWCYAFPLDLTADYPIPIFVRGDDVCFGLQYCAGHMVTVNGIGVWHQDFSYKNGPVAFFYEARNIPLMLTVSRPDYDASSFRKRMVERTMRFAWAFKYDTATAFLDGVEAYLDGPDALLALSADELNDEVRGRYGERLEPLPPDKRTVPVWAPPGGRRPTLLRAAALSTLGGHLLPAPLRRKRTWAVRADSTPAMAMVGSDELVFRHDATGEGFVARRDQQRFRAILRRMRTLSGRISRDFDTVANSWREAYPKLVSDGYWRDQFAQRDPRSSAEGR